MSIAVTSSLNKKLITISQNIVKINVNEIKAILKKNCLSRFWQGTFGTDPGEGGVCPPGKITKVTFLLASAVAQ